LSTADESEEHEIRCCSDTAVSGYRKNSGCSVWATSLDCQVDVFSYAVTLCENAGARLCTRDELTAGCTTGAGCQFDFELIWSSTPIDIDMPSAVYSIACGNQSCDEGLLSTAHESEEHEIRCCSDTAVSGYKKKASCSVWATSLDCQVNTHSYAVDLCENAGARLCTIDELTSGCTAGAGCRFDFELIWSSTSVTEVATSSPSSAPIDIDMPSAVYYVACGKQSCTEGLLSTADESEEHEIRCCSDIAVSGYKKNSGCSCWATSLDCQVNSYSYAVDLCENVGARLCTREELASSCTAGSGCRFDYELIWSSTLAS